MLRLLAAAPALALTATACAGDDDPDPLVRPARAAKSDAAQARAIAQQHPELAEAAEEVDRVRSAHARSLLREIDRVAPRDPQDPSPVPDPPPGRAPGSSEAASEELRTALHTAQRSAADLAVGLPPNRCGLVGSVAAGCASLLEVLG
ncbi:hypothetical protein IQ251_07645 [Saccharopolyspora sp. HNM0983]|uniref:Uncharacterized protein n=1 Tax=Saccharopolyspora montiporae TaxID=2781240 RepID=A0A929B9J1_9PSEU|nr:hypothetical protein [Saccharopolyspora sp. HNM0983]